MGAAELLSLREIQHLHFLHLHGPGRKGDIETSIQPLNHEVTVLFDRHITPQNNTEPDRGDTDLCPPPSPSLSAERTYLRLSYPAEVMKILTEDSRALLRHPQWAVICGSCTVMPIWSMTCMERIRSAACLVCLMIWDSNDSLENADRCVWSVSKCQNYN